MSIPAAVTTATVHHDAPVSFSGDPGRVMARFTPSASLVWEDTGTPLASFFDAISPENGAPLEFELPHTDQVGFVDGSGNTMTNWHYSVKIWFFKDGQNIGFPSRDFQISSGQSDVDLALIPSGEAVDPTVAPMAYVTSVNGQTGDLEIESLQGEQGIQGIQGEDGADGAEGPAGPVVPLDSLTDVTAPTPSDGQALIWDAGTSQWVNQTVSTASIALDSLTDVTAPSPTDGQSLVWDSTTSKWINETPAAGASTLDDLTDVDTTGAADDNVLTYDSGTSTWVASAPAGASSLLAIATKSANYTLTSSDQMVTFTSGSTATLPDPTTVPSGTVLRVKNLQTSALALTAAAGKLIDGTTLYSMPQYHMLTVVSDAVTWHVIATTDVVQLRPQLPADADFTRGSALVIQKDNWPHLRRGAGTSNWNVHPLGFTGNIVTKTTSQTLAYGEAVAIFNNTSLTCTLPAASTSGMVGRHFVIKNIHSTPLALTSASNIDGTTTHLLSQWDKVRVISDGTSWHIVEGRKQVSVSTTAPTAPVEGDVWFDIS